MQTIKQSFQNQGPLYPIEQFAPVEDILFIDIETTGLSPKTSSLYLIGCAFYRENTLHTIQWFADSPAEEADILGSFFSFVQSFSCLMHYNGSQFDLPYLNFKAEQSGLSNPLSKLLGIDIYKMIKPVKKLLSLTSLRQKAIEDFLNITRNDQFDGGQLISVYKDYVKTRNTKKLSLLLLHNEEDLLGMHKLLPILNYLSLTEISPVFIRMELHTYEDYTGAEQTELLLFYQFDASIPHSFSTYREQLFLSCDSNGLLSFRVPVVHKELKLFYSNYKDYYYLPMEDCCIHKSVAASVDKEYRCNAKKDTCYTKHTGAFLPQFAPLITPCFQEEYKTKNYYFEYRQELLTPELLTCYGRHLLEFFCK